MYVESENVLTSSAVRWFISFFETRRYKKYCPRKSSYLLNNLGKLNEIFRKYVAYDNIKIH